MRESRWKQIDAFPVEALPVNRSARALGGHSAYLVVCDRCAGRGWVHVDETTVIYCPSCDGHARFSAVELSRLTGASVRTLKALHFDSGLYAPHAYRGIGARAYLAALVKLEEFIRKEGM
jgi:hypothetical protein